MSTKRPKAPWSIFFFLMVITIWLPIWIMFKSFSQWAQAAVPATFVAALFFTVGSDSGTKYGYEKGYELGVRNAVLAARTGGTDVTEEREANQNGGVKR